MMEQDHKKYPVTKDHHHLGCILHKVTLTKQASGKPWDLLWCCSSYLTPRDLEELSSLSLCLIHWNQQFMASGLILMPLIFQVLEKGTEILNSFQHRGSWQQQAAWTFGHRSSRTLMATSTSTQHSTWYSMWVQVVYQLNLSLYFSVSISSLPYSNEISIKFENNNNQTHTGKQNETKAGFVW